MARFKVPKKVVFGPLTRTGSGKIQKFVLREQAKALSKPEPASVVSEP
jgi:fatty-acyl-CoA synthase